MYNPSQPTTNMSSQTNQQMSKKTAANGSPPPFQQRPIYPPRNQQPPLRNEIKLPNNQWYSIPEKTDYYYDKCRNPIEEICTVTDNLEQLSPEFRYAMLSYICQEDATSTYGEYDAPPCQAIVDKINGSGGHFLKLTVEAANIYLIWYNRAKNTYMFWGPTEQKVRDAMNRIRGRIVKYTVHVNPATTQTPIIAYKPVADKPVGLAASPPPPPPRKDKQVEEDECEDDEMPPLMDFTNRPPSGMQRSISCAYDEPQGLQRSMSLM